MRKLPQNAIIYVPKMNILKETSLKSLSNINYSQAVIHSIVIDYTHF